MVKRVGVALVVLLLFAWTQGLFQVTQLPLFPDRDFDGDGLDNERERELGTNPFDADTDGDGLGDWLEVTRYGTDPTAADTDGDSYPDGVEVAATPPVASADPLRKDVYVEIDYMAGHRPSREQIDRIAERFATAPVENPDGSSGIELHLVVDDAIPASDRTTPKDLSQIRDIYFNNSSAGYHYAVIVDDVSDGGFTRTGFQYTGRGYRQMAVEYQNGEFAATFMHELGHSLGIDASDYEGVDSHAVSGTRYRSIMNYNYGGDGLRLSRGPPFDDWAHINDSRLNPPPGDLRRHIAASEAAERAEAADG
jgi:hypothetical protein